MASEILSNLQLGSLIINATKINALSANTGALISAPASTVTDSSTAASGTLSQFNAHYLAAPTLAAANTGVTTTTANTLTIAGAPTAGTNETLTNAYALNVLNGAVNVGGTLIAPQISSTTITAPSAGLTVAGGPIKCAFVPTYGQWYLSSNTVSASNSSAMATNGSIPQYNWTTLSTASSQTLAMATNGAVTTTASGIWSITLNLNTSSNGSSYAMSSGINVGSVTYWQSTYTSQGGTNSTNCVTLYIPSGTAVSTQYSGAVPQTGTALSLLSICLVRQCA